MGTTVQKARYDHIDVAKGIGILLVIGLHCNFHVDAGTAFEMPLFYFMSGLFVSSKLQFSEFAKKKARTIMVPCIVFYLPIILYNVLFYFTHHGITMVDCFKNSAIPSANWFLLSLFEVQLAAYFIIKYCRSNKPVLIVIAAVCSLAGYCLAYYNVPSFAFINTSVSCMAFFILGYAYRQQVLELKWPRWIELALAIAGFALCGFLFYHSHAFIFWRNNVQNAPYYVIAITAVTGIFAVVSISKAIKRSALLQFYGRYSLIVLCTHIYVMKLLAVIIHNPALLFFAVTAACAPVVIACRRWIPRLCGL